MQVMSSILKKSEVNTVKITKITKVKKGNVTEYLGTIDVDFLVDYLTNKYIKQGKGKAKIRANIPGKGWVYLTDISEVIGEVYIGLPLDEAEEIELSMMGNSTKEEETKEETKEEPKTNEGKKGSK